MQVHEIEAWAKDRLVRARERNDGNLDVIETAMLRGQIQTLKELLALEERGNTLKAQARFVTPEDDSHGF
jgi:hypothetical protein